MEYYEAGLANMNAKIDEIASEVFDCAYFKKSMLPAFEKKNRDDYEIVSYIWDKMFDTRLRRDRSRTGRA